MAFFWPDLYAFASPWRRYGAAARLLHQHLQSFVQLQRRAQLFLESAQRYESSRLSTAKPELRDRPRRTA